MLFGWFKQIGAAFVLSMIAGIVFRLISAETYYHDCFYGNHHAPYPAKCIGNETPWIVFWIVAFILFCWFLPFRKQR